MPRQPIQSDAFEQAALHSERQRCLALIIVLTLLIVVALTRYLIMGLPGEEIGNIVGIVMLAMITGAFVIVFLQLVRRAEQRQVDIPRWAWPLSVAVECLFPTAMMMILTHSPYPGPYRSIIAPTVLLYPVFITLGTLRLRPGLAFLSGALSAGGYVFMLIYTLLAFPEHEARETVLRLSALWLYPIALFVLGGVATAVTFRLRRHVLAALHEAELQRDLDRVNNDLSVARTIQQNLLPRAAPPVTGYDVAGWSQPADATGGDYYDWQDLPDGRLVISLADATGHGIGPALVTCACRAYARACMEGDAQLQHSITRITRLLVRDLDTGRFVTFVAALLDPRQHAIEILSAGHGPLYFYSSAAREIRLLDAQGLPLGIDADEPYDAGHPIALEPGDFLALFTDGFFEWARDDGQAYGMERLKEELLRHADAGADDLISRVRQAVQAFVGDSQQPDDLTAVVIRRVR